MKADPLDQPFRGHYTPSDHFALFEDNSTGTPIEVIPMRGEATAQKEAVMHFWRNNPAALKVEARDD